MGVRDTVRVTQLNSISQWHRTSRDHLQNEKNSKTESCYLEKYTRLFYHISNINSSQCTALSHRVAGAVQECPVVALVHRVRWRHDLHPLEGAAVGARVVDVQLCETMNSWRLYFWGMHVCVHFLWRWNTPESSGSEPNWWKAKVEAWIRVFTHFPWWN